MPGLGDQERAPGRLRAPCGRLHQRLARPTGKLAPVEFRVLGSVGIVDADQLLPVGGEKPRRLLGMLLAHRNTVVSAERLVDALWAEPPDAAGATLQSYVSRLRRFVELGGDHTSLRNRAPGYVLEVPDDLVDAGRFERRLADGQALLDTDPFAALDRFEARARRVARRRVRGVRRRRVDPARGDPPRRAARGGDRGAHRRRAAHRTPRAGRG